MSAAISIRPPTAQASPPLEVGAVGSAGVSAGGGGSCGSDPGRAPEHWMWVPGYEGLYRVSDHGRLISLHGQYGIAEHEMKARPGRGGYLYVCLSRPRWTAKVHRLVLAAFAGSCPDGMVVRHLNGVPTDNRLSNLRYGTPGENRLDQIAHGTARVPRIPVVGACNGNARLTENTVLDIRRRHADGESKAALALAYDVSDVSIGHIIRRRTWKHVP